MSPPLKKKTNVTTKFFTILTNSISSYFCFSHGDTL
jgi:hypothetical protein